VPEQDRDQSVEHVLRRVLTDDAAASPDAACIDGETIAAWTAQSLRADEAATVERHVADCARCRALMASFLRTTPAAPVVESFWQKWRLAWLVPLATAATAAALWIAVPGNEPATVSSAPPASPEASSSAAPQMAQRGDTAAPPETPAPAAELRAASPERRLAEPKSQAAAAEPPTESSLKKQVARDESVAPAGDVRAAQEAAAQPALPAAAPAPPAVAPARERAEADSRQLAGNAAPSPLATARFAAAPVEIVAPDGSARWRLNGQQVTHFTSTANEWAAATISSANVLIAGTSPAASVCWIVGRGGAVYLTTDGTRFQRLPSPDMTDLVGVTAVDDRTATVSSADGRIWRTTDQGRSWSRER
jgi:hypothetical protein